MDALSNALGGLRAAQLHVDAAAANVSNLDTPDYRPDEVEQTSEPGGGVTAAVVPGQVSPPVPGSAPGQQPSGTDLVAEIATLVSGPIAYDASARVVDASVAMTRSLLDVRV